MKSLGKKTVTIVSTVETRVVYVDSGGKHKINWFEGHRTAEPNPEDVDAFIVKINARRLSVVNPADVVKRMFGG